MYDKEKLRAVPIVEVAKKLNIAIKKSGANFLMQCLWHEDKKPSMILRSSNNRCHCFACGENSDTVGLVMKAHNINFKEACEWLEREGYEIRTASPPSPLSHEARGNPFGGRKNVSKIQRLEALQALPLGGGKEPKALGEGLYFLPSFLDRHISMDNSFAICLRKVFGEEAAAEVVRLYRLGTLPAFDRYDDVMFPSIDIHGNIHDIKIQAYECDERSNRFFHSNKDVCYWLKATLSAPPLPSPRSTSRKGGASLVGQKKEREIENTLSDSADSDGQGYLSTSPLGRKGGAVPLFGSHLLPLYPSKTVVLVESPKNACVGAAVYPQYLWVATGNKCMLKREVLEVLRGRKVVVYPDNDAFDEWQQKLRSMQDIALFVCKHTPGDTGEKGDIADWLIASPPKSLISSPSPTRRGE